MPLKAKAQRKEMGRDQTQKVAFGQPAALLRGQRAKPVLSRSQDITTKQAGVAAEGFIPGARKPRVPKPRKGEQAGKAGLTMHSTFQTGSRAVTGSTCSSC